VREKKVIFVVYDDDEEEEEVGRMGKNRNMCGHTFE
jgi:hypothetical protein